MFKAPDPVFEMVMAVLRRINAMGREAVGLVEFRVLVAVKRMTGSTFIKVPQTGIPRAWPTPVKTPITTNGTRVPVTDRSKCSAGAPAYAERRSGNNTGRWHRPTPTAGPL